MGFTFITPNKHQFWIDVKAEVLIDNGQTTVDTAEFPTDDLSDTIHIPRDSTGFIRLTIQLKFILDDIKTRTILWNYSKQGSNVVFPRWTMTPNNNIEVSGARLTCTLTPSSSNGEQWSVSVGISMTWNDDKLPGEVELWNGSIKLTAQQTAEVKLVSVYAQNTVVFRPFVTNRSDRLEKLDLVRQVREWFWALHPDTQVMISKAVNPDQMPGQEALLIRGYTSSLGPDSYNFLLGADRAQKIKDLIGKVSGNTNSLIYRTPSEGEVGPTDVRREENNNPENRKVAVTYWDR
jgi:hypothetical protein